MVNAYRYERVYSSNALNLDKKADVAVPTLFDYTPGWSFHSQPVFTYLVLDLCTFAESAEMVCATVARVVSIESM